MDSLGEATKNLLTAAAACVKEIRAKSSRLLPAEAEAYWRAFKGSDDSQSIGRQRVYNYLKDKDLLALEVAGNLLFDYLDRDNDDLITFGEFIAGFGLRRPGTPSSAQHQSGEGNFGAVLVNSVVEHPVSSAQNKQTAVEQELTSALKEAIHDLVSFEKKRVTMYNSLGFNLEKIFSLLSVDAKRITKDSIRSSMPELSKEQACEVFIWLTRGLQVETCGLKELRRAVTPIAISFDELTADNEELFDLSLMKYYSPSKEESGKKESLGGFGFSFQEDFELREIGASSLPSNPLLGVRPGQTPQPISLNLNYNFDSMSDKNDQEQLDMLPTERKSPSKFVAAIRFDEVNPTRRSNTSDSPNSKMSTQRGNGRNIKDRYKPPRESEGNFYRVSRSPTPSQKPPDDRHQELSEATYEQRLKAIGPIDEEKLRSARKRYQNAELLSTNRKNDRFRPRAPENNKNSSSKIALESGVRYGLNKETTDSRQVLRPHTDSAARIQSLRKNNSTYRDEHTASFAVLQERDVNIAEERRMPKIDTSRKLLHVNFNFSAASLHKVSGSSPMQTGRGNRSSEVWHSIERTLPSTSRKLSGSNHHSSTSTYASSAQPAPQLIKQTEVVKYTSHRYARYY